MKSRHSGSSLPVEGSHDAGHFQSGLGSLQTTIVILIETADFGLLSILEQQNFVDDWNFGFDLDERERLAHGLTNVLGMCGLPTKDHPKADDRGITRRLAAGEACSDDRNFVRAGHAHDTNFRGTRVL